ncbi:hypothetical protein ABZP36_009742 [Zizania latifolia]
MATGSGGAPVRRTGSGAQQMLTELFRSGLRDQWTHTELESDIKGLVTLQLHIATALKVMAYLAFTWSTVVLLGGYVSSLQRKDFQCLTVITVIEANITFSLTILRFLGQNIKFKKSPMFAYVLFLPTILSSFYMYGQFICIGLSSWRLRHRDYADASITEASFANLTTALDFFYALVLCQEWFKKFVEAYTKDSRERCAQELADAEQVSLLSYAVGLLESGSQEEYLSAARMLDCLIKNGEDASTLILGSRQKAQRLLDTLGSTQGGTELRLLAARIVADLAGGVRLAQFPGSLRCVSSLLEAANQPYCTIVKTMLRWRHGRPDDEGLVGSCCCDELVVQGLTILQRLARDPHNCAGICQTPGLLAKITAPIHSGTLIHDMAMNPTWADITNCSLRVVHRLIHVATGEASTMIRRQISSDKQAVTNLEGILDGESQQLQMRSMEILSELQGQQRKPHQEAAANLLSDGGEQEEEVSADSAPVEKKTNKTPINNKEKEKNIKATAGKTLSTLSNKSQTVSRFVVEEHSDIVNRLTQMLHPKNNIRYRIMSTQILENLCIHCKEHVSKEREILLPKVTDSIYPANSIFNDTEAGGMLKQNPWNIATGAFAMANLRSLRQILKLKMTQILAPFFLLPMMLDYFYAYGPYICVGLSSWRLKYRAYASASNGEASLANLTTALDFFYMPVLCQGVLYFSLLLFISLEHSILVVNHMTTKNISSETWFTKFVEAYSNDTRERCAKDLAAAEQVSLLSYAVGLLESGSQEEYLSAARMLDCLIKNGQDASALILGSRRKAKRLLDTLGITQGST